MPAPPRRRRRSAPRWAAAGRCSARVPAPARSSGSWRGPAAWRWRPRVADRGPARRLRREQDLDAWSISAADGAKASTIGWIWSGWDAPHPRVAEAARRALGGGFEEVELAELRHDAVRRRLGVGVARGGDLEAWRGRSADARTGRWRSSPTAGSRPRCAETKSIRPNDSDSTRGCAAIAATSASAPCVSDQHVQRDLLAQPAHPRLVVDQVAGSLHVREAPRLGQHHVGQAAPARRTRISARRRRRRGAPGAAARRPGRARSAARRRVRRPGGRARPRRRSARRPRSRA